MTRSSRQAIGGGVGVGGGIADARDGTASSPRAVTRGESPKAEGRDGRVLIDWLNCTFDTPAISLVALVEMLGKFCGCAVTGDEAGVGMFGFTNRVDLRAYVRGVLVEVGFVAYGGEHQRGRWMLQLTGKGCGLVRDWESLQELLDGLGATITRVDIAADFKEGEHTVVEARDAFLAGEFTLKGRKPTSDLQGDWNEAVRGRTMYIGRPGNGKQLCIYEKGKQLGDFQSAWTRFELRLGNRDRTIPLDVLTRPEHYYCGAYPYLAGLLEDVEPEAIPTEQVEGRISMAHILYHMRRCYGKAIHQALDATGVEVTELVEEMRIVGMPRRLDPAGVVSGLSWPEIKADIERKEDGAGCRA